MQLPRDVRINGREAWAVHWKNPMRMPPSRRKPRREANPMPVCVPMNGARTDLRQRLRMWRRESVHGCARPSWLPSFVLEIRGWFGPRRSNGHTRPVKPERAKYPAAIRRLESEEGCNWLGTISDAAFYTGVEGYAITSLPLADFQHGVGLGVTVLIPPD